MLHLLVFVHPCASHTYQPPPFTFAVQSSKLLLELVHEAADGGADGSQVEVGADADRRPIVGLGQGWQRCQILWEAWERKVTQGTVMEMKI